MNLRCFELGLATMLVIALSSLATQAQDAPTKIDNGWKVEQGDSSTLWHTSDGGKHWADVTPHFKGGNFPEWGFEISVSPLDLKRAWAATAAIEPGSNGEVVLLEYTVNGGKSWKETVVPIDADGANISFLDDQHGFLLNYGSPGGGYMAKHIYATEDGGRHWKEVPSELAPTGFYVTGISFRSATEGWVGGTNHGGDAAPLYRTEDGGKTWRLQLFPVPPVFQGKLTYANTYPPHFIGSQKLHGTMTVVLVNHSKPIGHATVQYTTNDGGNSWQVPPQRTWTFLSDN